MIVLGEPSTIKFGVSGLSFVVPVYQTFERLIAFDRKERPTDEPPLERWNEIVEIIRELVPPETPVSKEQAMQFYEYVVAASEACKEHRRETAAQACRLANFYPGVDPRTLSPEERTAWDENRPRVWAERLLMFGDISGYSITAIQQLAKLAFGDNEQATGFWKEIYKQQLMKVN